MHGSISIERILLSRNCDYKTTKCEKRHGRFYLGKVSKNSNTPEIEHCPLNPPPLLSFPTMDFISGQLISPTNPIHRIPGQFVNTTLL